MRKKIGITGASGFIGGSLAIELKRRGYTVYGLDVISKDHLLPYMDKFEVEDYGYLPSHSKGMPLDLWLDCDAIIHCAGTSLVGPSIKKPIMYYENNVAKTINLLTWMVNMRHPGHFIFSSSASVYKTKNTALTEEDTLQPLSPYAKSKMMIENVVEDFRNAHGLKACIFRYFNACGAMGEEHGQDPDASHIFPKLFESNYFTLNGSDYNTPDGSCVRDYIHVRDIVNAHALAIESHLTGVYNLGNNFGYSNLEIIKAVEKAIGKKNIALGERRKGDSDTLVADNTMARTMLGWAPVHTLDDIIKDLEKWYNSKIYKGYKWNQLSTNTFQQRST